MLEVTALFLGVCGGSAHELLFVAHDSQGFFHLLNFMLASSTSAQCVILLVVIALTLEFEFLRFDVLFDLVHICQTF